MCNCPMLWKQMIAHFHTIVFLSDLFLSGFVHLPFFNSYIVFYCISISEYIQPALIQRSHGCFYFCYNKRCNSKCLLMFVFAHMCQHSYGAKSWGALSGARLCASWTLIVIAILASKRNIWTCTWRRQCPGVAKYIHAWQGPDVALTDCLWDTSS